MSVIHDLLLINQTLLQKYQYKDETFVIVKPVIGSLLYRYPIDSKTYDLFVVVKTERKRNGTTNRGIIDTVTLKGAQLNQDRSLVNVGNKQIMIFWLTPHGSWWKKSMNTEYIFSWDNPLSLNGKE